MNESESTRVAIVIFAAGMSKRMGSINKLLLNTGVGGTPMIRQIAEQAIRSAVADVYVVVGYQEERIRDALSGLDLKFIHNDQYHLGLSASLQASVRELGHRYNGLLIALGDMPYVTSEHFNQLLALFVEHKGQNITLLTCSGKKGNPVLWPDRYFRDLALVKGDKGGRNLLRLLDKELIKLEVSDELIFRDIDDYEHFKRYQTRI